jgi:hypothetical protein
LWATPLTFIWLFIPVLIQGFRKFKITFARYSQVLLSTLLLFVGILAPLETIGGELNTRQCENNVIDSHEAVGVTLKSQIPEGAKVFWAIESWMMFLYFPEVEIYPPQTMIHYNFVSTNPEIDQDFVLRHGYWNEELKEKWIQEADLILVEGRYFKSDWRHRVEAGDLVIIDITDSFEECRGDKSRILILQNKTEE